MISRADVEHAARLARLQLAEGEVERMRAQLSGILGYIDKLGGARHGLGGAHFTRRPPRQRHAGGRSGAVLPAGGDAGQRARSRRGVLPRPAHHRGLSVASRSIHDLAEAYRSGETTPSAVTEEHLARIERLDDRVGAYLTVMREEALTAAREADARHRQGRPRGPLDGIPLALKDNLCARGVRATAASRILERFVPPYDATVVERLQAAGAVLLGKTNLDEFAMGSSTEHSAYHPTRNPWDLTRVPGGSSGGSAAAVAAGMAVAALGSDTGVRSDSRPPSAGWWG